ncbi:MAG: YidC/Oxa1 family membrane protein insertase [Anaerolineales bacterium]
MEIWGAFVETISVALFALSQIYGGNLGCAIITLSLIVRLALLPLSLHIGRKVKARQELMHSLQPKVDRIKVKYRQNPQRQSEEVMKLYRQKGVSPFDILSILGNIAQIPVFFGLLSAIRKGLGNGGSFLWIKDIAQPDAFLALIVAGLTYISTMLSSDLSQQSRALVNFLPVAITLIFAWRLAAGIGMYWASSTVVGLVQSLILNKSTLLNREQAR